MSEPLEAPETKRAMFIFAHCDDIEFGCVGTAALWVRDGYEVIYVILTDSSRGSEDPDMTREKLVSMRIEEQNRAAAVIGVHKVIYLGYEDGALIDSSEARRDVVRQIRTWKPERVVCFDPTMRYSPQGYINHPDHVQAGNIALAAIFPFSRNRPSFRELLDEGLEPFSVKEVYLTAWQGANCWIDIESTFDLKLQALREHKSQLGEWNPEEMMRAWSRRAGAGQLLDCAEAYRLIKPR